MNEKFEKMWKEVLRLLDDTTTSHSTRCAAIDLGVRLLDHKAAHDKTSYMNFPLKD